MTTLMLFNERMNNIMKIIKSLEKFGFFKKGVSKTIRNEAKEQKDRLLSMFLVELGASLLRNPLTGKGTIRVGEGTIRPGKGTTRAAQDF